MQAFIKFNRGILKLPVQWRLWMMLLVTANLIVPLFYLGSLEAQVVLSTMALSMGLFTILTARFGFTRILGLGHILWIPLLVFLWSRLGENPTDQFYGLWIRGLMILNSLSLMLDGADVFRYITGDRAETVPGL